MNTRNSSQAGFSGATVAVVLLVVAVLLFGGLAIWSFINFTEQKNNVDAKISAAVAVAEKKQAEKDQANFAKLEKEPNRTFTGPEDLGSLSFSYPKTWSLYVASNGSSSSGGNYQAYFSPISVPSVSPTERYALRVTVADRQYDTIVKTYEARVKKGDLRSSAIKINGENATRFDGNISKDLRGAVVILKIRDKTVTLQTDADTFKADFDALVTSIQFKQ